MYPGLLADGYSPDALMAGFVGRIGPADVRLDVVDAADGFFGGYLFQEGTDGESLFGLRVDPDPAKMIDVGKQVISSLFFPAIDVSC